MQAEFRFEGFTFDAARGLLRGDDREIDLRPKTCAILRYLVEHAGRLAGKDELIEAVWPDVVVTEDSLTRCVSELRLALCDTEQRIIKTVQRRGYVFAATVSRSVSAVDPSFPDRPSIAVLPFANLSGDPNQDYFVDGLSEDLITSLSKFADLFVIARHSAFKYKGTRLDAKQIGHELGVRYLLVGSMRRDRDRVRISAQLVDIGTGTQRWAQTYDRNLTEIFAIQDDVTQNIVITLIAHITKSELDRAVHKPPESLTAYDYYLRGEAAMKNPEWTNWGEVIATSRALYERAIAADSRYAPALQGLAFTYVRAYLEPTGYSMIGQEYQKQATIDRALSLAQRAIELDGNLPEAHATLAWILHWEYRRNDAIAEFERAFELNPNLADPRFGNMLCHNGNTHEAIEYLKRIMRLDPFHSPLYYCFLGNAYYQSGRYEDALNLLRTATSRMPGLRPALVDHAAAAGQLGLHEEARQAAARVIRLQLDFTITSWLRLIRLAKQDDADRLAEGLRKARLPE